MCSEGTGEDAGVAAAGLGWGVHGAKGKEAAAARAVVQRGAAQAATLPPRVTGASEHVTRYDGGALGLSTWSDK